MSVTFKISGDKLDFDPVIEAKLGIDLNNNLMLRVRNPGGAWNAILRINKKGLLELLTSADQTAGLQTVGIWRRIKLDQKSIQ